MILLSTPLFFHWSIPLIKKRNLEKFLEQLFFAVQGLFPWPPDVRLKPSLALPLIGQTKSSRILIGWANCIRILIGQAKTLVPLLIHWPGRTNPSPHWSGSSDPFPYWWSHSGPRFHWSEPDMDQRTQKCRCVIFREIIEQKQLVVVIVKIL